MGMGLYSWVAPETGASRSVLAPPQHSRNLIILPMSRSYISRRMDISTSGTMIHGFAMHKECVRQESIRRLGEQLGDRS